MTRSSENMERYYQRQAREDHRSTTWYPIFFFVGLAGTIVHYILREEPPWALYVGLAPALPCLAVVWGLWRAQEWARWVAGLLLAGVAVAQVLHMAAEGSWRPIVETIMVGLFAVLMLHPDTKERFAYLRAGRERERAGGSTAA